ncbi:MAG: hypothetical protein ACK5Y2_08685 [Bdellovibrionales bacterium]
MLQVFLVLVLSVFANASEPECLNSYYDLGPQAAALGLACRDEEPGVADLIFCKREHLVNQGYCSGLRWPIRCDWHAQSESWQCEEKGNYPLKATVKKLPSDQISYSFRSSFNSGVLTGRRVQAVEERP